MPTFHAESIRNGSRIHPFSQAENSAELMRSKSVQDLFFTSTKITCSMLSHKSSFYAYSLTSFLHPDYYASIARANGDGAIPSPRYYEQPTPHANALNHPHHTLRLTKHQSATTTYLRAKGATRYPRINNGNRKKKN